MLNESLVFSFDLISRQGNNQGKKAPSLMDMELNVILPNCFVLCSWFLLWDWSSTECLY